jgi:hypothetical protein
MSNAICEIPLPDVAPLIRTVVMAGFVPAIHVLQVVTMAGGYLYILASAPNGILYVGVPNLVEEFTNIGMA